MGSTTRRVKKKKKREKRSATDLKFEKKYASGLRVASTGGSLSIVSPLATLERPLAVASEEGQRVKEVKRRSCDNALRSTRVSLF